MIGELNRRVNLKQWGETQDDSGGLVVTIVNSYLIWAKVEDRNGRMFIGEQQAQWSYDYKVTFRYEKSRPVNSGMTIDYDSKRLVINSLSYFNEGNRKFCVCRCSATDLIPLTEGGQAIVDSSLNLLFRVGDVDAPVDAATTFTLPALIGLTKNQFSVFRNGLPMWHEDYGFDGNTGTITLLRTGDKFTNGEQILIK